MVREGFRGMISPLRRPMDCFTHFLNSFSLCWRIGISLV